MALVMVVIGATGMGTALVLGATRDFGKPFPMFVGAVLAAEGAWFVWMGWPTLAAWLEGED